MSFYYVSYTKMHYRYFISKERLQEYQKTQKTLDVRHLEGPERHFDFYVALLKDEHPLQWALDKQNIAILNFWEIDEETYKKLSEGPKNAFKP